MVAESTDWGSRLLLDTRMAVLNATHAGLVLPRRLQIAAAASICCAAVAFAGLGAAYVAARHAVADREKAVIHAESANADLQDFVARLQDRLGAGNRDLGEARRRLAALAETRSQLSQQQSETQQQLAVSQEASSSKAGRIAQLTRALDQAQRGLRLSEAERVTFAARLSKAEADLQDGRGQQAQVKASLDDSERRLQLMSAERDKTAAERDRMRARISELEQQLALAAPPHMPKPVAAASPPATVPQAAASRPPGAARTIAGAPASLPAAIPATSVLAPARVAAVPAGAGRTAGVAGNGSVRGLAEVERVLASTGVDVAQMFAKFDVNRDEGGPFVPPRGGQQRSDFSAEKLAAMRGLAKSLPLSAPLDHYQLRSPFGPRRDPENGESAFHTGIDLAAPYDSPVYATAAGTVTYAGYRDDYGKIVEIDHGHGISTRYAHLHRYTVLVGERVAAHAQIGYLGSSGRATGPHVHYEVLVNGEPQDPEKFMALARIIPVAEH